MIHKKFTKMFLILCDDKWQWYLASDKISIITEHACFIMTYAMSTVPSGIIDVSYTVLLSYRVLIL